MIDIRSKINATNACWIDSILKYDNIRNIVNNAYLQKQSIYVRYLMLSYFTNMKDVLYLLNIQSSILMHPLLLTKVSECQRNI